MIYVWGILTRVYMKIGLPYFSIALTLLFIPVCMVSMETEPKKLVIPREILFQKWLDKKISMQTNPGTLTPEGLAYILYCFPQKCYAKSHAICEFQIIY